MKINERLQTKLMALISNFTESVPVYSIKQLTPDELEKNGMYFASKFMMTHSIESFRSNIQRFDDSSVVHLPEGTKMRLFYGSNSMFIKRNMGPLENVITKTTDKKQLTEYTTKAMKKLDLEKWKLSFENVKFERLWQIKANGITAGKKIGSEILCRAVGAFRRHLNKLPVYGRASIFVKIAGNDIIESAGIDWRSIDETPIDTVKIIKPNDAAEMILRNLNSYLPDMIITSEDYKPQLFSLGYFSLPRRQVQNYMQPVYVAMFKSIGWSTLNRLIVIPASNDVYEPFCRIPKPSRSLTKK